MEASLQTDIGPIRSALPQEVEEDSMPPIKLGAGLDFEDPKSRLAPYYLRVSHIIAALVLGVVFVLISHLAVWHTDVWGHMRFGEYIVQHRRLPTREEFSGPFADQDALYVNYQWLAQAGAYWFYQLGTSLAESDAEHRLGGGALMLSAAHAVIVTLRLFLLLLAFRRVSGSQAFGLVGVGLVFVMGLFCHLLILRPQILGELAFAALLVPLSRPVLSRRALVLIPLVFVLWANSHGSFPMGFVLVGIFLAGQTLAVVLDSRQRNRTGDSRLAPWLRRLPSAVCSDAQTRRLGLVLLFSLASVVILNPHGPALLRYSWDLSHHPNIQFMEEWKPLPLKSISGLMFLGSLLLLLPLLRWSPARFTPTQVLLLGLFGWQSLAHSRVLVWWIMVMPCVAVPHLHALCRRYLPRLVQRRERLSFRNTLMTGMAAVAVFMWSGPAQWFCWGDAPLGSKRVTVQTPVRAASYLRSQFRRDPSLPRHVFASETVGDYLFWDLRQLDPPVHVFAYTHVHLFTPEHWRACMLIKAADPGWEAILEKNDIHYLVVDAEAHTRLVGQVRAAPERWQVVATEPILIAKRKQPAQS